MKDYYEILEVNPKASKEVIEKAYKVLAKRYHPDLQEENQKKIAEQKMKLINEAYEVLSDNIKRKEYDEQIEYEKKQEELKKREEFFNKYNSNTKYTNNTRQNNIEENEDEYDDVYEEIPLTKKEIKAQRREEKRAQREYREEQEKEYRNYLRSLGYRVKEKWTWKKFKRLLQTIGIIIIVILILWIFPPTHNLIVQTYEENNIVKAIIDIIINIFKGIGAGIGAFFGSLFGNR